MHTHKHTHTPLSSSVLLSILKPVVPAPKAGVLTFKDLSFYSGGTELTTTYQSCFPSTLPDPNALAVLGHMIPLATRAKAPSSPLPFDFHFKDILWNDRAEMQLSAIGNWVLLDQPGDSRDWKRTMALHRSCGFQAQHVAGSPKTRWNAFG